MLLGGYSSKNKFIQAELASKRSPKHLRRSKSTQGTFWGRCAVYIGFLFQWSSASRGGEGAWTLKPRSRSPRSCKEQISVVASIQPYQFLVGNEGVHYTGILFPYSKLRTVSKSQLTSLYFILPFPARYQP